MKCDDVEEECRQYSIALGSNAKGAGSTVGELRKEHILPRRYEMLTEAQEKLRQVRSHRHFVLSITHDVPFPAVPYET